MNTWTKFLPFALVATAALAAPGSAQNAIKIGELNSYKAAPAFLDPYKRGIELAVDEINAGGGVLGRKLELSSAMTAPIRAMRCGSQKSW
jgi:branched-chain amino acid transport system substrate-binding protein